VPFWKKAKPRPKLFIVRWRAAYYYYEDSDDGACQPGDRLSKAFTTRAAAEQYRQAVQRGRLVPPAGANPFLPFRSARVGWYDGEETPTIAQFSSMPEPVLDDWLQDLGLTPPAPERIEPKHGKPFTMRDWDAWWEANVAQMTDHQRCKIWEALDRLDFFEIVETELEE